MTADISTEKLPALLSRAAQMLQSATTSGEILEAREAANAVYAAAKIAGRMARAKGAHDDLMMKVYRAQGDALMIEARAKMLLADEYDAAQRRGEVAKSGQRSDLVGNGNEVKPTAADLGLRRDQIFEARQLRDAEKESPGVVARIVGDAIARGEEPSKATVNRELLHYRGMGTGQNEWYTPAEYISLVRDVMGAIDLDPASCAEANKTIGAVKFFTQREDGLRHDWIGRVWLNPPYSRTLVPQFAEKLKNEVVSGNTTEAIGVFHNTTDTRWFHSLAEVCAAICFPNRRIKFYRGEDVAAPVNGQMFMYFGKHPSVFAKCFVAIGNIWRPL